MGAIRYRHMVASSGLRTRTVGVFCAASLLFFLGYTAPHRVHHFFDARTSPVHTSAEGHHDQSGPSREVPGDADCVFQVSASRCADGLSVAGPTWETIPQAQTFLVPDECQFAKPHTPAPFQSRAPPAA